LDPIARPDHVQNLPGRSLLIANLLLDRRSHIINAHLRTTKPGRTGHYHGWYYFIESQLSAADRNDFSFDLPLLTMIRDFQPEE
jgi:hypothetical protein